MVRIDRMAIPTDIFQIKSNEMQKLDIFVIAINLIDYSGSLNIGVCFFCRMAFGGFLMIHYNAIPLPAISIKNLSIFSLKMMQKSRIIFIIHHTFHLSSSQLPHTQKPQIIIRKIG
jgi:hypothetical protein